ncbi:MAG: hypothetical protein EBU90_25430 [Proteobacteria bacterium]|nr:hypothetical protein [Pseudomonadota bacterium]NBP16383.1 hypothetical protein [bacterium]
MKICQLIDSFPIALTNQEKDFVDAHKSMINLNGLSEQETWIAQNLVRKGVYSISKDSKTLLKQLDES